MKKQVEKICTGCGRSSLKPLGLNVDGEPFLACCPDNNYVEVKKQSSIDWLILEDWELTRQLVEKEITIEEYSIKHYDLVDQAKAMHKEEIENAYKQGVIDEAGEIINTDSIETTYYSETFE